MPGTAQPGPGDGLPEERAVERRPDERRSALAEARRPSITASCDVHGATVAGARGGRRQDRQERQRSRLGEVAVPRRRRTQIRKDCGDEGAVRKLVPWRVRDQARRYPRLAPCRPRPRPRALAAHSAAHRYPGHAERTSAARPDQARPRTRSPTHPGTDHRRRGRRTHLGARAHRLRTPVSSPPQGTSSLHHHRTGPASGVSCPPGTGPAEHVATEKELAEAEKHSWVRVPRFDYTPSERLSIILSGASHTGRANGPTLPAAPSKSSSPRSHRRSHFAAKPPNADARTRPKRHARSASAGKPPWNKPASGTRRRTASGT